MQQVGEPDLSKRDVTAGEMTVNSQLNIKLCFVVVFARHIVVFSMIVFCWAWFFRRCVAVRKLLKAEFGRYHIF